MIALYTFGDSVLDSRRYSVTTAGEIVAHELNAKLIHCAADGATSEDLDRQWHLAEGRGLPTGLAMVSIGGNDILHRGGVLRSDERFLLGTRLNRLLLRLKTAGIKPYVATIYDPSFGDDEHPIGNFFDVSAEKRAVVRRYYEATNAVIMECAEDHGVLVDLHARFLKGNPAWFTYQIEPSAVGAEEIAKAFLEKMK